MSKTSLRELNHAVKMKRKIYTMRKTSLRELNHAVKMKRGKYTP